MKYIIFSHLIIVEGRTYKSYGIVAVEKPCIKLVLKDVSMDKKALKELVKSLNEQQIRLNNLNTVLNNFFDQ